MPLSKCMLQPFIPPAATRALVTDLSLPPQVMSFLLGVKRQGPVMLLFTSVGAAVGAQGCGV